MLLCKNTPTCREFCLAPFLRNWRDTYHHHTFTHINSIVAIVCMLLKWKLLWIALRCVGGFTPSSHLFITLQFTLQLLLNCVRASLVTGSKRPLTSALRKRKIKTRPGSLRSSYAQKEMYKIRNSHFKMLLLSLLPSGVQYVLGIPDTTKPETWNLGIFLY